MISAIASSTTLRVLENGALNTATPRAGGGGQVDLVGADAERADRQQVRRGVQHPRGHLRLGPDAEQLTPRRSALDQLVLVQRPGAALDLVARPSDQPGAASGWMFSSSRARVTATRWRACRQPMRPSPPPGAIKTGQRVWLDARPCRTRAPCPASRRTPARSARPRPRTRPRPPRTASRAAPATAARPLQPLPPGDPHRSPLDHDIQARPQRGRPGGQHAPRVGRQVPGLLLLIPGAEVQRPVIPDGRQRRDCGRPSARTVDSQKISARVSTPDTSAHGRAVAPGELNPACNCATGAVPAMFAFLSRRPALCLRSCCTASRRGCHARYRPLLPR